MRIRCAELSDFAQIMELYGEASDAMAGTAYDCRWRRDGHPTRDFVRGLVVRGGMLVAEDGGVLAGAVGFDHDLGHDYADAAWLAAIGASPFWPLSLGAMTFIAGIGAVRACRENCFARACAGLASWECARHGLMPRQTTFRR